MAVLDYNTSALTLHFQVLPYHKEDWLDEETKSAWSALESKDKGRTSNRMNVMLYQSVNSVLTCA